MKVLMLVIVENYENIVLKLIEPVQETSFGSLSLILHSDQHSLIDKVFRHLKQIKNSLINFWVFLQLHGKNKVNPCYCYEL